MARLPGAIDLGPAPNAAPTRPVATYDTSSIARGGAALAEGGRQLAAGIVKAGEGIADYGVQQDRWEYAQAHSDFITKKMDLDEQTRTSTEYGPDASGKALPERYQTSVSELQTSSASLIRSGPMRDRFLMDTRTVSHQGFIAAQQRARSLDNDASVAYVGDQGNAIMDRAVKAPDDTVRLKLIDTHNDLVDGLVAKGAITQVQAASMKQAWAHQYASADVLARAEADPQGAINALRAQPGSLEQVTSRIVSLEGSTKNERSSAIGVGQFIDGTWLDIIKRNRPDLAQGRSDADILALRADKQLGRDMVATYQAENGASLQKAGLEASPGNLYLAHFLGPGGAAAVLKADPKMPVVDALAKVVGPAKAKEMVEANPTVLQGQLVGTVTDWANGKMGGAAPGIYELLRPDVREQLLQRAQVMLDKRTATDTSDFKTKYEDSLAEAGRNGTATNPLSQADFIRVFGAKKGLDNFSDYQSDLKLRSDVSQVARMTPQQQDDLVKSYEPDAGESGFADQAKREVDLQKAVALARKERDKDPAQFAIQRIPSVQEAWGALSATLGDATAPMHAKQGAARDFANKTELEQQKAGVASTDVRILPKGYVDTLKARLDNPQEAGGTANVVQQLKNEAALWGDAWPKVYRQIAPDVGPLVRVIGSGVSDTAGRILAELAPQKVGDIIKDQSEAKAKQIGDDVRTAFTPFIKSMAGNEGAISVFNDFRTQGEKLSAYYIVQGMSSGDAAAKAFKELIGDRYEFRDSWRAPKGLTVATDDIQRGTVQAMRDLETIGIAPPRDTIGGLKPDYLMKAKADAIRRDGKWVTAPDESGLALIYNDEAVRGSNGKPLILSWSQLGAIAERVDREGRNASDLAYGAFGAAGMAAR